MFLKIYHILLDALEQGVNNDARVVVGMDREEARGDNDDRELLEGGYENF